MSFDDLMAAGSIVAARAAGKARIEGREYVMRDGDVVGIPLQRVAPGWWRRRGVTRMTVQERSFSLASCSTT